MGSRRLAFSQRLGAAGIAVLVVLASSYLAVLGATTGWPTYQHDAARSGMSPDAAPVTAISAGWNTQLDEKIYGQPLVAGSLVFAATENNTVYALDVTSGAIVWQRHLALPARLSQLPCGNIDPYGITSTPVIDTANGVLYAVTLEFSPVPPQTTPSVHHELYALNLNASGTVLYRYAIDAPGSDPLAQGQRGALTLANNRVYVPFAGRWGDCGRYAGRVVGVNTGDTTGGSLVNYVLPNTSRGGIWAAASADGNGNLYVASGNSNASGSTPDRGESVIKLSAALQELDYFTAPEWSNLNSTDTDIGSIGPILLQNGWLLQSGKSGMGYLLNSASMGRVGGQLFEGRICDPGQEALGFGAYLPPSTVFIPCTSALKAVRITMTGTPGFTVTTVRGSYSGDPGSSPPIIAGGVVWNLDTGNRLLLGFDPNTGQQLFSQSLAGTPVHFVAPSSGAGHVFVPSGSILEAFSLASGGPTPTSTPTTTTTATRTPTAGATSTPTTAVTSTPSRTATTVVVSSTSTSTPSPQAQASYTSRATGSSDPVVRGTTFTIKSTVTGSQTASVLIDVEVYDQAWNKVFQQFWDNQALVAGQPMTFTSQWQVPVTSAPGTYTTMIGVFPPGWGTPKNWNGSALTFSVTAAAVPTPTSTATPTNTPKPTSTATPLPTSTATPPPTSTATPLSTSTVPPTPTQVSARPTFTSGAMTSAASIRPGGSVSFTASVKSNVSFTAQVDLEVYDSTWHKVFQQFWEDQSFVADQPLSFPITPPSTWSSPSTASSGTYTVMIGVFSRDWSTLYNWNNNAATFTVN